MPVSGASQPQLLRANPALPGMVGVSLGPMLGNTGQGAKRSYLERETWATLSPEIVLGIHRGTELLAQYLELTTKHLLNAGYYCFCC